MVANTANHSNGTNGHFLSEPIDITPMPSTPRPKWRDAFPTFTHNMSWQDAEGCSHSMTIRSDDLGDLMSDLRLLKGMIRQAKQQAAESTPQPPTTELTAETDVKHCAIHNVDMPRRASKRQNGASYFAHFLPSNEICYGREKKT